MEKRVAPLMVRLYDPILPRAFGAANAEVRRNAVNLLAAAFPIMVREGGEVQGRGLAMRWAQALAVRALFAFVDLIAGLRGQRQLPHARSGASDLARMTCRYTIASLRYQDPEAPAVENNTRMTQQMSLLMESLADSCPVVREAAAAGCCHVLDRYWELIPAATSAKIMSDITSEFGVSRVGELAGLTFAPFCDCGAAQPAPRIVA